jgi:hypothetical protein
MEDGALIMEGSMRLSSMNSDVSLDDGNSIIDCEGVEKSVQDVDEEAFMLDCTGLVAAGGSIPIDL